MPENATTSVLNWSDDFKSFDDLKKATLLNLLRQGLCLSSQCLLHNSHQCPKKSRQNNYFPFITSPGFHGTGSLENIDDGRIADSKLFIAKRRKCTTRFLTDI